MRTSGAVYEENGNCLVAVSEGIHYADCRFVSEAKTSATDGFGHAQLGGLAAHLAAVVKERMGVKVRGIELSLLQRCAAHNASAVDVEEAFMAGKVAVESAVAGETGKMVAFQRRYEDGQYKCDCVLAPLDSVANYEKKVPAEWITPDGTNVTQDFIDYALPLIQGQPERRLKTASRDTPGSKKCLRNKLITPPAPFGAGIFYKFPRGFL